MSGNVRDVMITGAGAVCPIGIGKDAFFAALLKSESGVQRLEESYDTDLPARIGGCISDFEPKAFVRPRKSLKVMCREIQTAVASAELAWQDAQFPEQSVASERLGVICACDMLYSDLSDLVPAYRSCMSGEDFDQQRWATNGMRELYPLWMLKFLPNMAACHVGIARDARGPCNTIVSGEVSSLLALGEGASAIRRGICDVMIVGGTGTRIHNTPLIWRNEANVSHRNEQPERASRPFDAGRDGIVNGEGAGMLVLESAQHAQSRGARCYARLTGVGNAFAPPVRRLGVSAETIRRSLELALRQAHWSSGDVGHVNAHGLSTVEDDAVEAQAIQAVLRDVPVTAPKGHFGNLGAGGGTVELLASLLALEDQIIPPTLNYEMPDPDCPVPVITGAPVASAHATAVVLNQTRNGHAVAVALERA